VSDERSGEKRVGVRVSGENDRRDESSESYKKSKRERSEW
jgi:hypothetical protein